MFFYVLLFAFYFIRGPTRGLLCFCLYHPLFFLYFVLFVPIRVIRGLLCFCPSPLLFFCLLFHSCQFVKFVASKVLCFSIFYLIRGPICALLCFCPYPLFIFLSFVLFVKIREIRGQYGFAFCFAFSCHSCFIMFLSLPSFIFLPFVLFVSIRVIRG